MLAVARAVRLLAYIDFSDSGCALFHFIPLYDVLHFFFRFCEQVFEIADET